MSLGKKTLRDLRDLVVDAAGTEHLNVLLADRLLREIEAELKPRRSVKLSRVRRVAKKASKRDETRRIRAFVFERAGDLCELCGAHATDLEHVFGRVRVKQKVTNCVALCRECHLARTRNTPSAFHWWNRYAAFFRLQGYVAEERLAEVLAKKAALRAQSEMAHPRPSP